MPCEIITRYGEVFIQADGNLFRIDYTGCGEAIALRNTRGEYVTAFDVSLLEDESGVSMYADEFIHANEETICAAITQLLLSAELKTLDRVKLEAQIKARMKEAGLDGVTFSPVPVPVNG